MQNETLHIGMFGPGVGVLHLANKIHHELPFFKITCFSDRLNSPYSTKDPETISALINHAIEVLVSQKVCQILAGCNTSSLFLKQVINERGQRGALTPKHLNLLELTVSQLQKLPADSKVLLLGSPLLAQSRYYTEHLTHLSIIEEGLGGIASDVDKNLHPERQSDYRAALKNIFKKHSQVDSIAIVCTHFEVLTDLIKQEADLFYGRPIPVYLQSHLVTTYLKDSETLHGSLDREDQQRATFNILTNDSSDKYRSYLEAICPNALVSAS